MKFGKFIMNPEHLVTDCSFPWFKGKMGYWEFDRRGTDIYNRGGLVSFRDKFAVPENVKSVRLTATALGVFEVFVNGKRVGDDEMKPGWTDYRFRVFELDYDITSFCRTSGTNVIVACVAPGWYSGRIANSFYGNKGVAFCAEIAITDKDNHTSVFATDESWDTAFGGNVRTSEVWDGELYDAREKSIFADSDSYKWNHAIFAENITCNIVPHVGETVKIKRRGIAPVSAVIYDGIKDNGTDFGEISVVSRKVGSGCERGVVKKGERLVIDFGVEFTARPRFKLYAPKNTKVRVYCGEMLNDSGLRSRGNDGAKGSVYIDNYRSALSRIEYISDGEVVEYSPLYTFFGYRYLEIVPDNDIEILYIVSDIIGSDLKRTGKIETSNAEVNKFIDNVYRGLESNYLSVPSDCPQRDERLGWTGDTQIFCGAAAYFVNAYNFLSKWMGDMRDSQLESGSFPFVAPTCFPEYKLSYSAAAWADAGIIVPYKMWLMYGDKSILADNYEAMEKYVDFVYRTNGLEGPNHFFGDWLAYEETPHKYISICYFSYDALLMERISRELGKLDRAEYYAKLRADINTYYVEKFVENGELKIKTQTGYLLPLAFKMLDGELYHKAVSELKANIAQNDYTLTTGFVGAGALNTTLSSVGLDDEAYSLLLQTRDPSWLYSVRQGATTVWERWNSYTVENGFGKVDMNSFNHYAYGAVTEWMFASLAGIKPLEEHPGFKKFVLAPTPDTREFIPEGQERITSVKAEFESAHGLIKSAWCYENGEFVYRVTVPENTEATVVFPLLSGRDTVNVNGLDFEANNGFEIANGKMTFTLCAGSYTIK